MPGVRDYMAVGVELSRLSHRGGVFQEVMQDTDEALRALLGIPNDYMVAYVGSAKNAMKLVPRNLATVSPHHLVNGAFGEELYKYSVDAKKRPSKDEVPWGQGFPVADEALGQKLERIRPEVLCATPNETSTGVMLDSNMFSELKSDHPDLLLAVDITSAVPYMPLKVEDVDVALFSVQKGFGMPAGLGVVLASPRAIERSAQLQKLQDTGSYQALCELQELARKFQTPETPNMAAIFTLGQVARDILSRGTDDMRRETELKARVMYEYFEKREGYNPFVEQAEYRSPTVIVIEVASGAVSVARQLRERFNVDVGTGYGAKYKDKHLRLGNFPAHSFSDVYDLLEMLDALSA